jgi:ABC-type branched-subunit amino acid transport system substrate-binding protein
MPDCPNRLAAEAYQGVVEETAMLGARGARNLNMYFRPTWLGALTVAAMTWLAACSTNPGSLFGDKPFGETPPAASPGSEIGTGQIKIGLILPLSAAGNAGVAAQSLKNAAEMAIAERDGQNIRLLVKDDGGTQQGSQAAAQQAVDEGAELLLGPLFGHSVGGVAGVARAKGIPVIAFSTNADVAASGVYLLSFLPESDVDRIVAFAVTNGKRSFAALLPDNAYGTVVEAAFKQMVPRRGGRIVALERYPQDPSRLPASVRQVAQAAGRVDSIFIPDGSDVVPAVVQALASSGVNTRRLQLLGTGLWDDPRIFANPSLQGGWYAAPDSTGFRNFSGRYRNRYGQDPARAATLAYDAVTLIIALAKTQGERRFSPEVLTNSAGFAGVDGIFRFRPDGTNERGLAVMRVTATGGEVVSPAPRAFAAPATR